MDANTSWLLQGPAWVQYHARRDLLKQGPNKPEVQAARQAMLDDPAIRALVAELAGWPVSILSGHKSAGHALHKLVFLADLGLQATDPGMPPIVERILAHQSPRGPFQVLMNIPVHFGGTGKDDWAWALCDAPLLAYALVRFGLGREPSVHQAIKHLTSLVRENGWPCAGSDELGKFRGPGRKQDPCPYANLIMLRLLAQTPAGRKSAAAQTGVEMILGQWENRRDQHPYMFYMGTDFCKLKSPLVWYDILHVADVLSQFPSARRDPRLASMAAIIQSKADAQGRYTPESVWMAWKDWEFSDKHSPSRWLTLLARRVLARIPPVPA